MQDKYSRVSILSFIKLKKYFSSDLKAMLSLQKEKKSIHCLRQCIEKEQNH